MSVHEVLVRLVGGDGAPVGPSGGAAKAGGVGGRPAKGGFQSATLIGGRTAGILSQVMSKGVSGALKATGAIAGILIIADILGKSFQDLFRMVGVLTTVLSMFVRPFVLLLLPPLLALIMILMPFVKLLMLMVMPIFRRIIDFTTANKGMAESNPLNFMLAVLGEVVLGFAELFLVIFSKTILELNRLVAKSFISVIEWLLISLVNFWADMMTGLVGAIWELGDAFFRILMAITQKIPGLGDDVANFINGVRITFGESMTAVEAGINMVRNGAIAAIETGADLAREAVDLLFDTMLSWINTLITAFSRVPEVPGGRGGGSPSFNVNAFDKAMGIIDTTLSNISTEGLAPGASTTSQVTLPDGTTETVTVKNIASKQFGGSIPTTGLYKMHAGERVTSANEARGGEEVTVNVTINNPNVQTSPQEFARMISDVLQTELRGKVSYG